MKRKYEIGFLLNPESSDEEVKKIMDSVIGIIEKAKGKVENIDEWGRRKLAYPIQKHNEGIYTFINTEVEGKTMAEIERRLKLSERVIRFIVLRLDDKLKKANRLTKKWRKSEKIAKKTKEVIEETGSDKGFIDKKEDENEKL
jgi:small subunit ribosomal protein S6